MGSPVGASSAATSGSPASTTTPAPSSSATSATSAKAEEKTLVEVIHPPQQTLGIEAGVGVTGLASGFPSGDNPGSERFRGGYHFGVYYGPNRHWALGLLYSFSGMGIENTNPQGDLNNDAKIFRDLHQFYLSARAYPLGNDVARFFFELRAGLAFEHDNAQVTQSFQQGAMENNYNPVTVSGTTHAGLGFGAYLGADVDLRGGLALLAQLGVVTAAVGTSVLVTSPQVIEASGTPAAVEGRLALAYRFNLDH